MFSKPRLLSDKELALIRGKASVEKATVEEIMQVFGHIDSLEVQLDEADNDDTFGPDGWRDYFGVPE
jgi:hypothetical protein